MPRDGALGRERIRASFEPSHMGDRIVELLSLAEKWRNRHPRRMVDTSFAIECACRGLEYLRAWQLSEELGHERRRLLGERDSLRRENEELMHQRHQWLSERREIEMDVYTAIHGNGLRHFRDPNVIAQEMIARTCATSWSTGSTRCSRACGCRGPSRRSRSASSARAVDPDAHRAVGFRADCQAGRAPARSCGMS